MLSDVSSSKLIPARVGRVAAEDVTTGSGFEPALRTGRWNDEVGRAQPLRSVAAKPITKIVAKSLTVRGTLKLAPASTPLYRLLDKLRSPKKVKSCKLKIFMVNTRLRARSYGVPC